MSVKVENYPSSRESHDHGEKCCVIKTDLLGERTVQVMSSNESFYAVVHSRKQSVNVPLVHLPVWLSPSTDRKLVLMFFSCTHLVPEKGCDGQINRVSVHLSGLGGVKTKIPFQPGLAMGSIIDGNSLKQMEAYQEYTTRQESLQEQMREIEQRIALLESETSASKQAHSTSTTSKALVEAMKQANSALVAAKRKEIEVLAKHYGEIAALLADVNPQEIPVFKGFRTGLESPIDHGRSQVETQPLGFESFEFNSQFISMEESDASISDKLKQLSSSNSFSGGFSAVGFGKAAVSHAWDSAVADRVTEIKKQDTAESVLVIQAHATTSRVRHYSHIEFDKDKLKTILDAMAPNVEGDETKQQQTIQELRKKGITVDAQGNKSILVLTQAILGGAFTALVTFQDMNKMARKAEIEQKQRNSTTKGSISAGYGPFKGNVGGSRSAGSGSRDEMDRMKTLASTRVNIEIHAQGAIPQFQRDVITREVMKHLNLDPSKFTLSQAEKDNALAIAQGKGKKHEQALIERQRELENFQVATVNTMRGLTSSTSQTSMYTPDSANAAFDSYVEQLKQDPNSGVPVGFNCQEFTQKMLEEKYKELTQPSAQQESI